MPPLLVIDIGTNSILSLLADSAPDGSVRILHETHFPPRLGDTFYNNKIISHKSAQKAIEALNQILKTNVAEKAQDVITVGTQIFRQAENAEEILHLIQKKTGLSVQVLSPAKEALLGFAGATAGLSENKENITLDIGGGSTEVTQGSLTQINECKSLAIGAVSIKEKFQLCQPPDQQYDVCSINKWIVSHMSSIDIQQFKFRKYPIGIGGTITTLAAMHQNLKDYEPDLVHGYILSEKAVEQLVQNISTKTRKDLETWLSFDAERSDIILSGALILQNIMQYFQWSSIQVSHRGLRYGIALSRLKKGSFWL